jgi:hypothetical protein
LERSLKPRAAPCFDPRKLCLKRRRERLDQVVAGEIVACGIERGAKLGEQIRTASVPVEAGDLSGGHARGARLAFRSGCALQALGLIESGDDDAIVLEAGFDQTVLQAHGAFGLAMGQEDRATRSAGLGPDDEAIGVGVAGISASTRNADPVTQPAAPRKINLIVMASRQTWDAAPQFEQAQAPASGLI